MCGRVQGNHNDHIMGASKVSMQTDTYQYFDGQFVQRALTSIHRTLCPL